MLAITHAAVHGIESARALIMLSAITILVFWRPIIKLALMTLAALMLALLGYGAIALSGSIHR